MSKHYIVFERMKDADHPWHIAHDGTIAEIPEIYVDERAARKCAEKIEAHKCHGRPMQAHVAEVELP